MDKAVNKKEYLKKYLSGGGDKKKKKRKVTPSTSLVKSKVIDDDIDFRNMKPIDNDQLEIYDLGEDAPQIAGIIDDRPAEIRVMSEYRETKKWKIVTKEYEDVKVSEVRNSDSDPSPPRGKGVPNERISKKEDSDSDVSVKRKHNDSHSSKLKALQPRRRSEKQGNDSDLSPARGTSRSKHSKPPNGYNSDNSPPRRRQRGSDSDPSPPRKRKHHHEIKTKDFPKYRREDSDEEPPRKHKHVDKNLKREDPKMQKTLEGKKAGLQDASELRREAAEIRQRQAESLAKLGDELSGRGASAVFRDKKTGRKRDLKEEAKQRREREEKEAVQAAKYAVWGKGVKQVDDRESKMKEDLHEMSKPLARYADDNDLENLLRNEEKDGDPMLEYIRAKKIKEGTSKARPQYQGSYLPNRYNIKPGYRWDGVDRSNGYEKKYFEEMNSRKAREEEAFKWSTEDM